jgi:hypothetical protein
MDVAFVGDHAVRGGAGVVDREVMALRRVPCVTR